MKLLVNKIDDSDHKPHFTSIIAPLPVKSYGLLTITAVNIKHLKFSVSKQSCPFLRHVTNAILDIPMSEPY
jgi:hypothetical protein